MNRPRFAARTYRAVLPIVAATALLASLDNLAQEASSEPPPPGLPVLSITLSPGGIEPDGDPGWVDVSTRITGMTWVANQPFLRIPVKFAGVPAVAYSLDALDVRDANGPVGLVESVDEPDPGGGIL